MRRRTRFYPHGRWTTVFHYASPKRTDRDDTLGFHFRNRGRPHMLGADANPDQPGRNPAKRRKSREEAKKKRRRKRTRLSEHTCDDTILDEELHALGHARRPVPPLLDAAQIVGHQPLLPQRSGQEIRGRNCVLDGEVDADAADGRHGVRRITDAQESGAVPLTQPIDLNGEQFDCFSVLQFADAIGHKRRELRHTVAKRRQPSSLELIA